MRLHDLPFWPPVWVRQDASVEKTAIDAYLRGELGLLLEAKADVAAIALTIEHDGYTWLGLVPLEAPEARLSAIAFFLRGQRGQPIQRIAALPLPD